MNLTPTSAATLANLGLSTDARALGALQNQANTDPHAAIRQAAKQLESLFMQELMKSMRDTTLSDGWLDNQASNMGNDMLDQQYATQMSGMPGGLADLNGLAVTDEGTTFLTAGTTGLVRVDAAANLTGLPMTSHDRSVFLVADRVCLVVERGPTDELACSSDDGATFTPVALPGFR